MRTTNTDAAELPNGISWLVQNHHPIESVEARRLPDAATIERRVLALLEAMHSATCYEMAAAMAVGYRVIRNAIKRLARKDLVEVDRCELQWRNSHPSYKTWWRPTRR